MISDRPKQNHDALLGKQNENYLRALAGGTQFSAAFKESIQVPRVLRGQAGHRRYQLQFHRHLKEQSEKRGSSLGNSTCRRNYTLFFQFARCSFLFRLCQLLFPRAKLPKGAGGRAISHLPPRCCE